MRGFSAQDRQVEDAAATAAAESDARALEEVRQREARLEAALAEAQASVANMRRLHQASQNQLFTMQASARRRMRSIYPQNSICQPPFLGFSCNGKAFGGCAGTALRKRQADLLQCTHGKPMVLRQDCC